MRADTPVRPYAEICIRIALSIDNETWLSNRGDQIRNNDACHIKILCVGADRRVRPGRIGNPTAITNSVFALDDAVVARPSQVPLSGQNRLNVLGQDVQV